MTRENIAFAILPLYISLIFFRFYFSDVNVVFFIIVLMSFLVFSSIFFIGSKNILTIVVILSGIAFFSSLNFAYTNNFDIFKFFVFTVFNVAIACCGYIFLVRPLFWKIIILFFYCFIIYCYFNGVDLGDVFSVSRNFISVYYILLVSFYIFSCRRYDCEISFLILFIGVFVCFLAIGRSGIIISLFVFVSFFVMKFGVIRAFLSCLFLFVSVRYFYFENFEGIGNIGLAIERFERLQGGGHRDYILQEYFSTFNVDLMNFIFAPNMNYINAIVEVDGNPHNSYISLHQFLGGVGWLFFMMFSFFLFLNLIFKKYWMSLVVLIAVLARAATDVVIFYGPLDIVFYFVVFSFIFERMRCGYEN